MCRNSESNSALMETFVAKLCCEASQVATVVRAQYLDEDQIRSQLQEQGSTFNFKDPNQHCKTESEFPDRLSGNRL